MKNKIYPTIFFFFLISLAFSSQGGWSPKGISIKENSSNPQNVPDKKPKYDYMSTFLSRSTKPLGLKEDPELERLLKQYNIKWAIRSGKKHILD